MKLTRKQLSALSAAFEKGGAWYGLRGSRAGGSYSRMCQRLADLGLLGDAPPHAITMSGLVALKQERAKRWAKHGSMATLIDLEKVDAALASERKP